MRKQIAAANWKMNCNLQEAQELLNALGRKNIALKAHQQVVIAVPFPFLITAREMMADQLSFFIAAQNCYSKEAGAFTGEVSAAMIASCRATHVIIGHSERRQYFQETNEELATKTDIALKHQLIPIFCCGEDLSVREKNSQNDFVAGQIRESLFHLDAAAIAKVVIAYEPIWAIGTGKTATAVQAQEMHFHIRQVIEEKYGQEVASQISILYGGSVKGENAAEIFSQTDVDGGLVGGASLKADEFEKVINGLKG